MLVVPAGHREGSEHSAAALPRAAGGRCQWELLHRQETSCHKLDRGQRQVCCVWSYHSCKGGPRGRKSQDELFYCHLLFVPVWKPVIAYVYRIVVLLECTHMAGMCYVRKLKVKSVKMLNMACICSLTLSVTTACDYSYRIVNQQLHLQTWLSLHHDNVRSTANTAPVHLSISRSFSTPINEQVPKILKLPCMWQWLTPNLEWAIHPFQTEDHGLR